MLPLLSLKRDRHKKEWLKKVDILSRHIVWAVEN